LGDNGVSYPVIVRIYPTFFNASTFIAGESLIAVRNEMKKGSAGDGISREF
jgi:hypothetical protein